MKKVFLVIALLALLGAGAYFVFSRKKESVQRAADQTLDALTGIGAMEKKKEIADPQLAVIRAKAIFKNLQAEDADFSNGPCIAEDLMPDWVADVAHNPRESLDDLPQNQCQSYREGKAHHVVELDVNGEVIKSR